ncbi:MAG: CoA transferase [Chloroflexota bacterium]
MLAGYRALDLTDARGLQCGKILADLGADVIKIERPGSDAARSTGPFYHDIPDPEKSLYWFAFNTSKRGVTLDIKTADGKALFKRLVETADFVIESFPPGYLDSLGLDYSELSRIKPQLIMCSLTPYGQTGPRKDYRGSDLTVMAMSGYMYLQGDPDRTPVRFSSPQSYLHCSAQAAVGMLIALYHREATGKGQHIDASIQQATVMATINAVPFWELRQTNLKRAGNFRVGLSAGVRQRQNWRCKDGYMSFVMIGGGHGAKTNKAMVEWLKEEGVKDDFLYSIDWDRFDMGATTQDVHERMEKIVGEFFRDRSKAEMHEQAVKREMMLYPVNTIKDLIPNVQLKSRGFWQEVEHPELGASITYPGSSVKGSEATCAIRRRPPLVGEHNLEVYGELGLSREEMISLREAGAI